MKKYVKWFCFLLWGFLFCLSIFDYYYLNNLKTEKYTWNVVQLQINWSLREYPKWYMGPLLAKEIFAPLIISHDLDLKLWRFHRRASRDYSGHQFSFIFFSEKEKAEKIFNELKANLLLRELIKKKCIVRTNYIFSEKSRVEDYSDPSWDIEMQKAWPEYAMGLSKFWLQLIFLYNRDMQKDKNIFNHYRKIERKLSEEWKRSAPHALWHHAHAMFAYVR